MPDFGSTGVALAGYQLAGSGMRGRVRKDLKMNFTNLVIAGTAVVLTAMSPQTSEARFGPISGVSTQGTSATITVSDDYTPSYGSGSHRAYQPVHYRGYRRNYRHRGYRHRGYRRPAHRTYRRRGAFYGGIVPGIVVGVPFIGGVYQPRPYYAPSRVYRHRPVRRRSYGRHEPWSAGWVRSCSARYRTFNPRTGYYFYKRGKQRFCR